MKIRIRERNRNSDIIYDVQIKRGLKWKTISSQVYMEKAIADVNALRKMEDFNKKQIKDNSKYSFIAWGVRNQYTWGIAPTLSFYDDEPEYSRDTINKSDIFWKGNKIATLKKESLFGEKGLEPRKYKITIEKVD